MMPYLDRRTVNDCLTLLRDHRQFPVSSSLAPVLKSISPHSKLDFSPCALLWLNLGGICFLLVCILSNVVVG